MTPRRRIQNLVIHLKWCFSRKHLTAESCFLRYKSKLFQKGKLPLPKRSDILRYCRLIPFFLLPSVDVPICSPNLRTIWRTVVSFHLLTVAWKKLMHFEYRQVSQTVYKFFIILVCTNWGLYLICKKIRSFFWKTKRFTTSICQVTGSVKKKKDLWNFYIMN